MVGLDLEAQRKAEQGGSYCAESQPVLLFKSYVPGVRQGGENPGQEGYCLHLGVVPHLDNLKVVGAERHGNCASQGEQRMHAERKHQKPGSQQRDEKIGCGTAACQKKVVKRLGPVAFGRGVDGGRGHTGEHRTGPRGLVVGMGGIPLHHLVGHTLPAGYIALIHYLTAQNLRHETIGEHEEQG